ncbi:hypothetical protein [Methanosphaerula palustris]|uniref:Uncharacterized protein n=1 Tax=Methanosphaerula palustris (strain ATCC BAA-1556 / DSM 19958 / E1-9c) TaxID=521011 RepID=B8GHD7_METPE|nr:hypothetical protein [Methanosphaerula palustris]ACL16542.1 conserved hypothetical protein [Methanosphaerula palustris E1-9c]
MDNQTRVRARNEIRQILEAASYDVEVMEEPLDLSAIRDGECILVLCSDDPVEITQFDQTAFKVQAGEEIIICKKLLFSLNEQVELTDCLWWGAAAFIDFAGKAAFARVLNRVMKLDPEHITDVVQRKDRCEGGILHLPVQITEQNARILAGTEGVATLRFIPHWLIHYRCEGGLTYRDARISFDADGWAGINAINGTWVEIEDNCVDDGALPQESEVLQAQISKEQAEEQMVDLLVKQLTKKVRIKQEKRDAIFYEDKAFRPDRSAIKLDIRRIFVPIWQIRGKRIVEINAFSGEPLSTPMDDGVEIL